MSDLIAKSGLSDQQVYWHLPEDNALGILGQDRMLVVINAYQGLNPDVVGRVSGAVIAGGALAIICPELDDWQNYPDPQIAKLIPYPAKHKIVKSYYLQRWSRILSSLKGVEHYTFQHEQATKPIEGITPKLTINVACTEDQQKAIDTIIKSVTAQRRRPTIITADRGRGKSAAMGLAAAQLISSASTKHVIITSSGFNKVRNLFKHAHTGLAGSHLDLAEKCLMHAQGDIRYIAPDTLITKIIAGTLDCDLLLVDEAASLNVACLEKLLAHFSRIAFASTEHGYEGSGRGFSLKFKQLIGTYCRGHYPVSLKQPIRWGEQDPLEQWIKQLLLLNDDEQCVEPIVQPALDNLIFEAVSQSKLAEDEALLQRIFHLLINAHYQTRPVDLRYLLDAPNSQLYLAHADEHIVGLIWLMHEGQLDEQIALEIASGKRRPQGHLVPQILAAHLGLTDAVTLSCARIQRIVMMPELQNKGIGSWMLRQLKKQLTQKVDYLASSFGADLPLTRFWNQAGFHAVRLSDKAPAASGLRSVVVLRPLSDSAQSLCQTAQATFATQFIAQLSSSLRDLSPTLACALATGKTPISKLSRTELEAAVLFAYANRPYESSLAALHKLAQTSLFTAKKNTRASTSMQILFIMRALQNHNWKYCAQQLGLSGKAECIDLLRHSAQIILNECYPPKNITALQAKYNLLA